MLIETDDDLAIGEFGIATRMVQGERAKGGEPVPEPQARARRDDDLPAARRRCRPRGLRADVALAQEIVTLTVDGKRREIDKRRVVIGRSKDCDVQLADPNVVAAPCRAAPGGIGVLADRPRLDERLAGERPAHGPREARHAAT